MRQHILTAQTLEALLDSLKAHEYCGLAQLFVAHNKASLAEAASAIEQASPNLVLMGMTTQALYWPDPEQQPVYLLSIFVTAHPVSLFVLTHPVSEAQQAEIAEAFMQPKTLGVVFLHPEDEHLEDILAAVRPGSAVVVGGLASETEFGDRGIWAQGALLETGGVLACLKLPAEAHVEQGCQFGWSPVGRPMLVTEADKNIVKSLNYTPVVKLYQTLFGSEVDVYQVAQQFPLLEPRYQGRKRYYVAHAPLALTPEGGMRFTGHMEEGQQLFIGYGNLVRMLTEPLKVYSGENSGALVFISSGRLAFLGRARMDKTLCAFKQGPFAAVYTSGEVVSRSGTLLLLNETLVYASLALNENTRQTYCHLPVPESDVVVDELKALAHLLKHEHALSRHRDRLYEYADVALIELVRVEQHCYPALAYGDIERFLGVSAQELVSARQSFKHWIGEAACEQLRAIYHQRHQGYFEALIPATGRVAAFSLMQVEEETTKVLVLMQDVTERHRLKEISTMFEHGPVVMFDWLARDKKEWVLRYVSPNVTDELRLPYQALRRGEVAFQHFIHPEDRTQVRLQIERALKTQQKSLLQVYRLVDVEHEIHWVKAYIHIVYDSTRHRGFEIYGFLIDITDLKRAQEALEYEKQQAQWNSIHDPVTGLYNRYYLKNFLDYLITLQQRRKEYVAILFIDLDSFKEINDLYGHTIGDMVLMSIASRLKQVVRKTDLVARFGGDEFIVVQRFFTLDRDQAMEGMRKLVKKIQQVIHQPIEINELSFEISSSMGGVLYSANEFPDDIDADTLLRYADTSMYLAKRQGKNQVWFFSQSDQQQEEHRVSKLAALRKAIENNELWLAYQGQFHTEDGALFECYGAEVLLRWDSKQWGPVSPGEFIPLAETSGFILELGNWVLEHAIAQLADWIETGIVPDNFVLSINVSAQQFHYRGFMDRIKTLMGHYPVVKPQNICLELTERLMYEDVSGSLNLINALHEQGFLISLDDFGTGYSSLRYLNHLPLHELKIDQSFVRDMLTDKGDQILVRTILNLAENFGLVSLAEGTETLDVVEQLVAFGCKRFQGYYFARPEPADHFIQRFRTD